MTKTPEAKTAGRSEAAVCGTNVTPLHPQPTAAGLEVREIGYRAQFRIGPTPEQEAAGDAIPYALTPSERTEAAKAAVHLEAHRRAENKRNGDGS